MPLTKNSRSRNHSYVQLYMHILQLYSSITNSSPYKYSAMYIADLRTDMYTYSVHCTLYNVYASCRFLDYIQVGTCRFLDYRFKYIQVYVHTLYMHIPWIQKFKYICKCTYVNCTCRFLNCRFKYICTCRFLNHRFR